jgi:hypothetical protein
LYINRLFDYLIKKSITGSSPINPLRLSFLSNGLLVAGCWLLVAGCWFTPFGRELARLTPVSVWLLVTGCWFTPFGRELARLTPVSVLVTCYELRVTSYVLRVTRYGLRVIASLGSLSSGYLMRELPNTEYRIRSRSRLQPEGKVLPLSGQQVQSAHPAMRGWQEFQAEKPI